MRCYSFHLSKTLAALLCAIGMLTPSLRAQISTFPYVEDFETSPAWTAVSVANSDWAWGSPNHTYVIQGAGSGSKCWCAGGLTGAFYNNWEQSYVKSPVFDFTNLQYPHIRFKLFYDCEYHFDGGNLQYSLNGGTTWIDVGTCNGTTSNPIPEANDCNTQNWYNYPGINYLNNPAGFVTSKHGWCGNTQAGGTGWDPTSPGTSCVGGNGPGHWITAEHCLTGCAGQSNVLLRFTFGSGFTCNNFDGFAFDSVAISNGIPNVANFTSACGTGNTFNFTSTFAPCPQTNAWTWDFGDPASGAFNTASTQNASHTFSAPGTYTVVLIAKGGACNPPDTVTNVVSVMSASVVSSSSVTCFNGNNGAATATVSLGTPPFAYAWTPSGGASLNASSLAAGNYSFTVTDANGCQKTATVAIAQPPLLSPVVTPTNIQCNGQSSGSATVSVSGGVPAYSYTWSPSGGNAASAGGLAAGAYSVQVKDANGCQKTATINISQPPALTGSVAVTNPLCGAPGSATITASGGTSPLSYSWTPSGGSSNVASSLPAGTYTSMVTDAHGCSQAFTATLSPSGSYTVTVSSVNVSCFGGSNGSATSTVTGTSGPYTYSWSPSGGTGASASGLTAGNYSLTVTDAAGCTDVEQLSITAPPKLNVFTASNDITCNGLANGSATITASGGTSPFVYSWYPSGGPGSTASSLGAGNYSVFVHDAKNCIKQANFTITDPPAITASASVSNALCGSPGSATVTASGGTGMLHYQWMPSGGASSVASLPAGTYSTVVSDSNNCQVTVVSNVAAPPMFTTAVTASSVNCSGGADGTASVTVSGSTGPYTYNWLPTGNMSSFDNNLVSGSYTVAVQDTNGCQDLKTFFIPEPSPLTPAVPNATICQGGQAAVTATVTGGTAPYSYQWLPQGASTPGVVLSPTITSSYTLNVNDAHNCYAAPVVITVSVLPPLSVTVNGPVTGCSGTTALLTATASGGNGNYHYSWQPGSYSGQQISPVITGTVQYTVTVNDGCSAQSAQATTDVSAIPTPTVLVQASKTSGCPPVCSYFYDSTLIATNNITSWHWTFSNGATSSLPDPFICFNSPGHYTGTLTVLAANGCSVTGAVSPVITVYTPPVADFSSNSFEGSVYDPVFNLNNTSTNYSTVSWQTTAGTFTSNQVSLVYDEEGSYPVTLTAVSSEGCRDSVTKIIRVKPEFTFYAPNTFTPNGDVNNESFLPMGLGWKNETYVLNIFDRWGELIYKSNDVYKGWDGRMKGGGDIVKQDVYVWKVELDDIFNKHHSYVGHITLLK